MAGEVAVIDSGGANIASVLFALERLGQSAVLTADRDKIRSSSRVILPGVGAARDAMDRLRQHELVDVIRGLTQPVLGVCLGMQLMLDASEEEDTDCLGLIPGVAAKLQPGPDLPVPNMGWCELQELQPHPIMAGISPGSYCYFVHSYAASVSDYTVASADHTGPFAAIVSHRNFVAAQFHPERSSTAGAQLLKNFLQISA